MSAPSILVCEDESVVAWDITQALTKFGYDVIGIAADAEHAYELLSTRTPDLVLMDIRLKGRVSGIELASQLWKERAIPSIYLTAYSDDDTLALAKTTMPLSYLLKPFDETELHSAIEVGLYRHQEHQRTIEALRSQLDRFCDSEPFDEAVRLERDFLITERVNSYLRIGGNIARKLEPELETTAVLLRTVLENESLSDQAKLVLQQAIDHHERARDVVDRLLRCSIGNRVNRKIFRLDRLVTAAMKDFTDASGQVSFVECFSNDPLQASVDRQLVKGALVNIIANAAMASQAAPVIGIGTSLVFEELPERFNSNATPGWFGVVKVEDMGSGMSTDVFERAFEPCFGEFSPNTGVGLCEVYSIMQAHGGWISLFSKEGVGTRVELFFPIAKARADGKREARTLN